MKEYKKEKNEYIDRIERERNKLRDKQEDLLCAYEPLRSKIKNMNFENNELKSK